jgi:hypothetical protein
MDAFAGKGDMKPEKAADDILLRHQELAEPHAAKYVEALRKRKEAPVKKDFAAEAKAIADYIAGQIPHQALSTIHDGMKQEMFKKVFDSLQPYDKEFDSHKVASEILDEHHALAHPHVKAFMEEMRKHYAPNGADDTPAGATGNPEVKNEPKSISVLTLSSKEQDPAPKADPAPEAKQVLTITNPTPAENKQGVLVDIADLKKFISSEISSAVTQTIRKAKGKLD